MKKFRKRILFFILMPIYGPLALFMNLTYAWWQKLNKGNIFEKTFFYLLAPIYGPIAFFLYLTYKWWAGLF